MSTTKRKVRPTASLDEFADVASWHLKFGAVLRVCAEVNSLDGCDDWTRDQWLAWLRPRGLLDESMEGRVILYTSAPEVYDGFGSETLDPDAGHDDRGRVIRKVAVLREHLQWQTTRYNSGLHGYATPEEAARFRSIWTLHDEG